MGIKINCIYNNHNGVGCLNKKVKRSLFGIGPRLCILFPNPYNDVCEHKEGYPKPDIKPVGTGRKITNA